MAFCCTRQSLIPNLDFGLKRHAAFFVHAVTQCLDQTQNIGAGATLFGNDEVGMLVADDGAADLQTLEPGTVDQRSRRGPRWVLEE